MDARTLLAEYDLALAHTRRLYDDLDEAQVCWRPDEHSSGIGWHLGHQAFTAHVLFRNLLAAEPSHGAELDRLFDSATPEPERGELPDLERLLDYRARVAASCRRIAERVLEGRVGAASQQRAVLAVVLRSAVNHEYQHDTWIDECRSALDLAPAPPPASQAVVLVDGYWMLHPAPDG